MSTQGYIYDDSFVADGAVSQYRIVVAGDTAGHAKLPAAQDAAEILGVSQHSTSASGDTVLVRRAGISKITVGTSTVTRGVPLRAQDIRGIAGDQTAAWVSGDGVLGYAEEDSSASGDIIECWLAIRQLLA